MRWGAPDTDMCALFILNWLLIERETGMMLLFAI